MSRSPFNFLIAFVISLGACAAFVFHRSEADAAEPAAPEKTARPAATVAPPVTMPTGELAAYGAVGYSLAESLHLRELQWSDAQFDAFVAGLKASRAGVPYEFDQPTRVEFDKIRQRIEVLQNTKAPASLADVLQDVRKKYNMQQTDSGLLFRLVKVGSGPRPTKGDVVTVSFRGQTADSSTKLPGLTADHLRVKVADLMPGLSEAVQMLSLDGVAFIVVPPALSFGKGDWPTGIQPGALLMFEVQLHDFEPAAAAP